jgi:DMSO/TMAO reductase YedYZ heme-binding membrane subunit
VTPALVLVFGGLASIAAADRIVADGPRAIVQLIAGATSLIGLLLLITWAITSTVRP